MCNYINHVLQVSQQRQVAQIMKQSRLIPLTDFLPQHPFFHISSRLSYRANFKAICTSSRVPQQFSLSEKLTWQPVWSLHLKLQIDSWICSVIVFYFLKSFCWHSRCRLKNMHEMQEWKRCGRTILTVGCVLNNANEFQQSVKDFDRTRGAHKLFIDRKTNWNLRFAFKDKVEQVALIRENWRACVTQGRPQFPKTRMHGVKKKIKILILTIYLQMFSFSPCTEQFLL